MEVHDHPGPLVLVRQDQRVFLVDPLAVHERIGDLASRGAHQNRTTLPHRDRDVPPVRLVRLKLGELDHDLLLTCQHQVGVDLHFHVHQVRDGLQRVDDPLWRRLDLERPG